MGSILCRNDRIYLKFKWAGAWHRERSGFRCDGTRARDCKCPGHKAAKFKLAEIEHQISAGFFDYRKTFPESRTAARIHPVDTSQDVTFRRRADLWMENKETMSRGTVLNYRSNVRKLVSWFGDVRIRDVKVSDIESMVRHYSKDLSGKSVQNLLGVLSGIMGSALKDHVIQENPVRLVENRPRIVRDLPPVYTKDEILAMLDHCTHSTDPEQIRFSVIIALGAFVGCRIYESLAMKPESVWLRRRKLRVERTLTGRTMKETTKTGKSRIVDIPAPAFPFLKLAFDQGGEFMFPTRSGSFYTETSFLSRKFWRPMLEALGLPVLDLRLLRHTFINLSIRAGADFAWIRDQVGHKDLKMIMAHYANVQQEFPGSGVPAFDQFIRSGKIGPNMDQGMDHGTRHQRTPTDTSSL